MADRPDILLIINHENAVFVGHRRIPRGALQTCPGTGRPGPFCFKKVRVKTGVFRCFQTPRCRQTNRRLDPLVLTRRDHGEVPDFIREYVNWGAGPRASQYLVLGAKARAILHGRYYVDPEDIRAVAAPVLRHRILTNFNAEAEGVKPDDIVRRLIEIIPENVAEGAPSGSEAQVFRSADAL